MIFVFRTLLDSTFISGSNWVISSPFELLWITSIVLEPPLLPQVRHFTKIVECGDTIKELALHLSKVFLLNPSHDLSLILQGLSLDLEIQQPMLAFSRFYNRIRIWAVCHRLSKQYSPLYGEPNITCLDKCNFNLLPVLLPSAWYWLLSTL